MIVYLIGITLTFSVLPFQLILGKRRQETEFVWFMTAVRQFLEMTRYLDEEY